MCLVVLVIKSRFSFFGGMMEYIDVYIRVCFR